jgi:hypothetical protein
VEVYIYANNDNTYAEGTLYNILVNHSIGSSKVLGDVAGGVEMRWSGEMAAFDFDRIRRDFGFKF